MLLNLLNHCYKDPSQYFSVLFLTKDGQARLDIIQNLEYRFLEIISLDFVAAPEELIRQFSTYRYNLLKAKT